MYKAFAALFMSSLCGCALAACSTSGVMPTATATSIMSPSDLTANGAAEVVETAPPGAVAGGTLDATACQAHSFDPVPTDELALALLQSKAARSGYRFLTGVTYNRRNIDLGLNCYWTITASGFVYR